MLGDSGRDSSNLGVADAVGYGRRQALDDARHCRHGDDEERQKDKYGTHANQHERDALIE